MCWPSKQGFHWRTKDGSSASRHSADLKNGEDETWEFCAMPSFAGSHMMNGLTVSTILLVWAIVLASGNAGSLSDVFGLGHERPQIYAGTSWNLDLVRPHRPEYERRSFLGKPFQRLIRTSLPRATDDGIVGSGPIRYTSGAACHNKTSSSIVLPPPASESSGAGAKNGRQ
ncbi:hypothetical protein BC827DRAFT_1384350 [Russula dissimulans]|nr:hypothetical protein BC827DRAFT_1384350 [Russula dissimulans]